MLAGTFAMAAATFFVVIGTGTASAIANGEPVPEGQYRFSTRLVMTGIPTASGGKRDSGCSGALIAEEWIITAGHCFRDANGVRVNRPVADSTVATIGKADVEGDGPGVALDVVEVRQSTTADVAIARLASPAEGIEPIAVADSPPQVGAVLRLTGYGSVTSSDPVQETRLRMGRLAVLNVAPNVVGVEGFGPAPDTTPCPFDSGGPFFTEEQWQEPELVSVVSNGPSCPHSLQENSARVDNLKDWIDQIIGSGTQG
ncbi:S1 family peptidase [Actinoplanes sp. G11-F43]|uniref:S1 family peptidase n=1 Tax=Actinoplanes sp. G11-F43 TaxID=3424130 RepID=UPI003D33E398